MAFDEQGQADTLRAQDRRSRAALRPPRRPRRLPARGHHLRPEHVRDRHRHRGARPLRGRLHRGDAADQATHLPHAKVSGGISNVSLQLPRQRRRCARRSTRCSSITRSAPGWTWASSTPGSSASTTRSIPELRERVEDVVLEPPRRTRPSGCSTLRRDGQGQGEGRRRGPRAGGDEPVGERLTHALVKGIARTSSRTPRRRAQRSPRAAASRSR